MTNFCNDSYCQVFLRRIPSRYRQSFHFFSFFFFNECEVSRFFRFGPFWLICRPPMGAPAPYLPVLVADTLVVANYLKNFIPNWYFPWFLKKNTWQVSLAIFCHFEASGAPSSQYGYRWAHPTSPYAVFLLIIGAQLATDPSPWRSDDFSVFGTCYLLPFLKSTYRATIRRWGDAMSVGKWGWSRGDARPRRRDGVRTIESDGENSPGKEIHL